MKIMKIMSTSGLIFTEIHTGKTFRENTAVLSTCQAHISRLSIVGHLSVNL